MKFKCTLNNNNYIVINTTLLLRRSLAKGQMLADSSLNGILVIMQLVGEPCHTDT